MLKRLFVSQWVSAPAIWGRLPAHATLIGHRVESAESRAWQAWLSEQPTLCRESCSSAKPAAFVLPPAALDFAPRAYVIGVRASSLDNAGLAGPLLVYQMVTRRWIDRQVRIQALEPRDWFFWLSRILACQAARGGTLAGLARMVDSMWRVHAPRWNEVAWSRSAASGVSAARAQVCLLRARTLFDSWADGVNEVELPSPEVLPLPQAEPPERLRSGADGSVFWQKDGVDGKAAMSEPSAMAFALYASAAPRAAETGSENPCDDLHAMLAPEPVRRADASVLEGLVDPHLTPGDAMESDADSSSLEPNPALFDDLNREFVRVVRDPSRLAKSVDWQVPGPASDVPAPTLEDLSRQARAHPLVRDVLQARQEVSALIGDEECFSDFELFEMADSRDVLRLFAPELPRDGTSELPTLVRRAHHVLSLDSPLPLQFVPSLRPAESARPSDSSDSGRDQESAASPPLT